MTRVTITDREQTVSFLANPGTSLRLIAACSSNPASLGELLIAADIYQRGIATALMAELMEFDKALQRNGGTGIDAALDRAGQGQEAFNAAFQVVDAITAEAAYDHRGGELVVIDLTRQAIQHSAGIEVARSGEAGVEAPDRSPLPSVTYVLPEKWTIQPL